MKKQRRHLEIQRDDQYSSPDNILNPARKILSKLRVGRTTAVRSIEVTELHTLMQEFPRFKVELFSSEYPGPILMMYDIKTKRIYRRIHSDESYDGSYYQTKDNPEEKWILLYTYLRPHLQETIFPYVRFTKRRFFDRPKFPHLVFVPRTPPWGRI